MKVMVIAGPDLGRTIDLSDGQSIIVGRGGEAIVRLRDPQVSRKHCTLCFADGKLTIRDLGSKAGTYINDESVTEKDLHVGDTLRIGHTELRLQGDAAPEGETIPPSKEPAKAPAVKTNLRQLIGDTIHHYRVQELLAVGRTGVVFKAAPLWHTSKVALKVLFPELSQNDEATRRFVRGMKTMLPIHHPNIVRIYNAGKSNSLCWVAMEYVEGESLDRVIARIGVSGMLDWSVALQVAVHIARGLEVAFEHQIIHRNITPRNILLERATNLAKLGDLMLAKALEGTLAEEITGSDQIVGDLAYLAPERTVGGATADCRSDIYSLGATVYALVTGKPPFEDRSAERLIDKILFEEPVKPKEYQLAIAGLFEGVMLRMLAKRPEDRYKTPSALLKDLDRVAKYEGISI